MTETLKPILNEAVKKVLSERAADPLSRLIEILQEVKDSQTSPVKAVYGDGPLWVTNVQDKLPIFIPPGATGVAALPPKTLPEMFHASAAKYPSQPCTFWRVADGAGGDGTATPSFYQSLASKAKDSHWESLTWSELEREVGIFAAACLAYGLGKKEAVIVMGFNSPQWLLAIHGVASAGGVLAGSYPTNNKETCEYLTKDCSAKIVLAENWGHGKKFVDVLSDASAPLSTIVVWGSMDGVPDELLASRQVLSFPEFMQSGSALEGGPAKVKAIESALDPAECAVLIYTSGTTGMPKGVMLSHDALTWDARATFEVVRKETGVDMGPEQVLLSYLPLSHIAAMVLDVMFHVTSGGSLYFATPDALSGGLLPLLQQSRPTFFFAVPRVWEKMMDAMKAKAADNSGLKKKIAMSAKEVGLAHNRSLSASGGSDAGDCGIKFGLFNKLVYSKVKETVGLDRAEFLGSGAAPISKEVVEFFWSLDVKILEGFGMSETCGVHTLSVFPHLVTPGCVGAELCDGAVKLDTTKGTKEGQGEICLRGRNIMMGYLGKPEKSAETFDEERYLRSGDLGTLTPASGGGGKQLLAITGRIKELIITAGGENVPPVLIEDAIKANIPLISNAVLIGDRRKFLSILLTLRVVIDPATLQPTTNLDTNALLALRTIGSTATTIAEAKADPLVAAAIQAGIDKYNKQSAASRAQNVQKFVVLDTDFSVPGGELTGTQKLKKNVVHEKYAKEIEGMYA